MKITTWNINGIRARIEGAIAYVREARPDVLCLQEIKTVDEGFPTEAFADLGYNVATHGQKGFNGVALLALHPLEDVRRGLPGDDGDAQARYIEASVTAGGLSARVASIYLPNGNPVGSEKFPYKLAWMQRLAAHAAALLASEMPVVLAGDLNVIPEPADAKRPDAWRNDALFQPESRAAFRALGNLGRWRRGRPRDQRRAHRQATTGEQERDANPDDLAHPARDPETAEPPITNLLHNRHSILQP